MQPYSGVFYCIDNPKWIKKCFPEKVYDTKSQDKEGKLALHKACECSAPIEVIKFILATYPDATVTEDNNGNIPLNYIFHHCLSTRNNNDLIDHQKMKYVMQVMEELLTVGSPSSVLTASYDCKNFFEMFVETFYPPIRALMDSSDKTIIGSPKRLLKHTIKVEVVDGSTSYTVSFVYKITLLLLKAVFLCTDALSMLSQQTFLPLHASLTNKRCPYVFSELIMRIDPSQAFLLNSNYNLLLYCNNTKICYSSLAIGGFDFDYNRILLWKRFSTALLCDDEREQTQVLFLILRENPLLLNVTKTGYKEL